MFFGIQLWVPTTQEVLAMTFSSQPMKPTEFPQVFHDPPKELGWEVSLAGRWTHENTVGFWTDLFVVKWCGKFPFKKRTKNSLVNHWKKRVMEFRLLKKPQ